MKPGRWLTAVRETLLRPPAEAACSLVFAVLSANRQTSLRLITRRVGILRPRQPGRGASPGGLLLRALSIVRE